MNLIAYTRVSTEDQAESGLGLQAQRDAIALVHPTLAEFSDPGVSGKTPPNQRPGLSAALEQVRDPLQPATGIVVAKLDRLSRSIADFVGLLAASQEEGWDLVILDLGVDTSTPNGRFLAHIIASVAQLERELISQRIKAAIQAKRDTGWRRPLTTPQPVIDRILYMRNVQRLTLAAVAENLNLNRTPTPRGGACWRPSTIKSIIDADRRRELAEEAA